jgi:hypothetical protein
MKRKYVVIIEVLVVLIVLAVFLILLSDRNIPSEQEACEFSGGEWINFSNACANTCDYALGEVDYCAEVITESCDCPSSECWNGEECVPI